MRKKTLLSLFACLTLSMFAFAQDRAALVEQILAAQSAYEKTLQQSTGSAVVRKSLVVKENPARVAALEQTAPAKLKGIRNSIKAANGEYSIDFAVKGDIQRVTVHEYGQAAAKRGAVMDDRIVLPDSLWRYLPGENRAYHAPAQGMPSTLGFDFRATAFNSLDSVSSQVVLRNCLAGAEYWDSSTRPDGMLVIKCGAEAGSPGMPKWDVVYVVNPAVNYSIVEFSQTSDWGNGHVRKSLYNVEWEQKDSMWVPKKASYHVDWKKAPDDKTALGDSIETCEVDLKSFDPKATVDDSLFTVERLNMAPGTKVNDAIANVAYEYKRSVTDDVVATDLVKDISTAPADSSKPVPVTGQPSAPPDIPSTTAAETSGLSTAAIWAISVFCVVCVIIALVLVLKLRARK